MPPSAFGDSLDLICDLHLGLYPHKPRSKMPVSRGDELAVPTFIESIACQSVVRIKWQQTFVQRAELYYVVKAQNISQGNSPRSLFFLAG